MGNRGENVADGSGAAFEQQDIIKEILALAQGILRSARYRTQRPIKDVLQGQGSCRYDFSLARSYIGSVYDLVIQLKPLNEVPELRRDGEGYDLAPLATPTLPTYYLTGDSLIDMSLTAEFLTEELMSMNAQLAEILESQSEVMRVYADLIKSASQLLKSLQKLRLRPLHRVD